MRFVGLDLAWGRHNPTGVAVLDGEGRLLDVDRVVTDDELIAWARPYTGGPCRVGVDAPIVVRNPTGARRCEREVGRWFGRHGASCYPSNTALPVFADGSRAAAVLAALELDVDPPADTARGAWEVYPHQAAVTIFALPTVLRYKAKPGRDLPGLRAELLRFMDLLESLGSSHAAEPDAVHLEVGGCAAWSRLRHAVATAPTKAALRRSEDPVDAVLVAYVARLATVRPARTRLLGDPDEGRILCAVGPELAARIDAAARPPSAGSAA